MSRKKLLIADDDRLILSTLGQGLLSAGYAVFLASSGEQAIHISDAIQPDLAILDVSMPGKSGIETAREIRENSNTPIIFLSAYSDKDIVENAVHEGALGYLVKPIDIPQILPTIESALARSADIHELKNKHNSLSVALDNSKKINVAVGIIMERYGLIQNESFEIIRKYARSKRIKLAHAADDLLNASNTLNITRDFQSRPPLDHT